MNKTFLWLLSLFAGGAILVNACNTTAARSYVKNRSHADMPDQRLRQGEALAEKYCQSCHMLPEPALLDSRSWTEGVLPQMGPRLGIFEYMYKRYPHNAMDPNVGRGFYPGAPVLSPEEWGAIIDYYAAVSPDSLIAENHVPAALVDTGQRFGVIAAAAGKDGGQPATTMVRYDPKTKTILSSDMLRHSLDCWDSALHKTGERSMAGAVVDVLRDSGSLVLCNIGAFGPNNAKGGYLESIGNLQGPAKQLAESLIRPVHIAAADLNGDGRQDLVVCEFGYIKGQLCWLENRTEGQPGRHVLRAVPGAIRVIIDDANHDGLPDIWALFAQGDEALFLYTNKGHGQFDERMVLRWPPSYGSTSFELDDIDKDGLPDIIYTCGDNGDFSTVLKPYHGIYIYRNEGNGKYTRRFFYPMNGCYRAMAGDFDGTGKKSIAAIAWFADYERHPEAGFVYLASKGGFDFEPVSIPATKTGRWMTMDLADVDGDGRLDILLGNCPVGPGFSRPAADWKKGPPVMLLRNRIFASK